MSWFRSSSTDRQHIVAELRGELRKGPGGRAAQDLSARRELGAMAGTDERLVRVAGDEAGLVSAVRAQGDVRILGGVDDHGRASMQRLCRGRRSSRSDANAPSASWLVLPMGQAVSLAGDARLDPGVAPAVPFCRGTC